MSDESELLSGFDGVARLFPLPNLVFFPHVVLPLHIFEPRYRQMTGDALSDNRLLAMVLLRPGWEDEYEGRPALHNVACLGRIINEQRLPDGKYNILLRGLCRVRLGSETPDTNLYRSARGEPIVDADKAGGPKLRKRVIEAAEGWLPAPVQAGEQFQKLLASRMPLGALCDVLGFALPIPVVEKQALLEELDIPDRARLLLRVLEQNSPPELAPPPKPTRYPPEFSSN